MLRFHMSVSESEYFQLGNTSPCSSKFEYGNLKETSCIQLFLNDKCLLTEFGETRMYWGQHNELCIRYFAQTYPKHIPREPLRCFFSKYLLQLHGLCNLVDVGRIVQRAVLQVQ